MISESHSQTTSDRRVELAVGSVIVIPHTTGRSNREDSDGDDQSIRPKSSEYEIVQSQQTCFTVISDRCEQIGSIDCEGCGREQVDHTDETACPHADQDCRQDDGEEHDLADSDDELPSNFAHGDCQSNTAAAT